jgi:hypothetical protein
MTPKTVSVCPSNFWLGVIADVSFILLVGEDMRQNSYYRVQRCLSLHPLNSKIITYKDNDDGQMGGHNWEHFGQVFFFRTHFYVQLG